MNKRLITTFAFAALATLLVASQAGSAMTMRANAAMSGKYLYLDQYEVIAWDAVGATVSTLGSVDPWQPLTQVASFSCPDPTPGCVQKAGRCDWTGETDDFASNGNNGPIPEWWETTPSEADLRWGVCAITSIRTDNTGDVIVQYRAGLRATSKVPALSGSASMVHGTWVTAWDVYWVDGDGNEIVELDRLADGEPAPMCKVNPLGNPDEYEGFRDPLNQLDFATCVWDPSRTINVSDEYQELVDAESPYLSLIGGFAVRAILDNVDDQQPAFEAPDSCPCAIS